MEEHDVCFWKKEFDGFEYRKPIQPSFAWKDWGLIPISRPYISTPKANYTIAQIPNSSNRLNITNYMPGGMTFESREGEWRFAIDHTSQLWKNWYDGYYAVEAFFHGARMLVALNDDPEKVYEGRIRVSAYEPGGNYSTVTLSYSLDAMPIEDEAKSDLLFRVRTMGFGGSVIEERFMAYGTVVAYGGNQKQANLIPNGATFSKWDPALPFELTHNVDIRAEYYFKASGNHPIRYVIEEPTQTVETTYEVPDTVKFLFNSTNHAIDFLGSQGETIKRTWYTPENVIIETT